MPPDFDGAPQVGVQWVNHIRRVHDAPYGLRKGEERDDLIPVPPEPARRRRIPAPGAGGDGLGRSRIGVLGSEHLASRLEN